VVLLCAEEYNKARNKREGSKHKGEYNAGVTNK
jgi:hypothetical protein